MGNHDISDPETTAPNRSRQPRPRSTIGQCGDGTRVALLAVTLCAHLAAGPSVAAQSQLYALDQGSVFTTRDGSADSMGQCYIAAATYKCLRSEHVSLIVVWRASAQSCGQDDQRERSPVEFSESKIASSQEKWFFHCHRSKVSHHPLLRIKSPAGTRCLRNDERSARAQAGDWAEDTNP
jgi:hypothetical protein